MLVAVVVITVAEDLLLVGSIRINSTLVIFRGSSVPVSKISTFWYTFGEFSHLDRSCPLRPPSNFFHVLFHCNDRF